MQADLAVLQQWIAQRDPEAFHTLVRHYSAMVYATCRRVLGNPTDAEDAAQESFQALAMLDRPPKGPLGPWLHKVAVYKSLNQLRAGKRRQNRDQLYAKQAPATAAPVWDDLYDFVDEAIAALPDKYRLPVVRHFLQCETQDAIAQDMGLTRQTVAYRIHCGLDGIRKSLRRHGVIVSAGALAAMFTANALEHAPDTLLASLGKMALLGESIPIQPLILPSASAGLFSAKGLAVAAALLIATAVIAVNGFLYFQDYAAIKKLERTGNAPAASQRPPKPPSHEPRPTRPTPPPAPPVLPEIDPAIADETVPTGAATEAPAIGAIDGQLRASSGETVPNTEVRLTRTQALRWASSTKEPLTWTATTDAEGNFRFEHLPLCGNNILAGTQFFRLDAEKDDQFAAADFQRKFWELSSNQELVLSPASTLEVAVLNEQGAPVSTGSVELKDAATIYRTLPTPEKTALDDNGHAAIAPLFPGTYTMTIHAPGYQEAKQLVAHDAGKVDVLLKAAPSVLFGKTVDAASGAPLSGVAIMVLTPGLKKIVANVESEADGSFTIAPGAEKTVTLYARSDGKCLPEGWRTVETLHRPGQPLTLALEPGGVIAGQALDPITGKGVPNIPVCFDFPGNPLFSKFINTSTDATGAYTLEGISGAGSVRALDWGNEALSHPLEVSAGARTEGVDFTLPRNCRVAGKILGPENAPVPGIVAVASPIRDDTQRDMNYMLRFMASESDNAAGISGKDGRFVCFLRGNTGDIWLQAFGDTLIGPKLGPVGIPETGLAGLILRVEPAGRLNATIVDEQGRPLPNVNALLQPIDPARGSLLMRRKWAITGELGKYYPGSGFWTTRMGGFSCAPLLPGNYNIMAFMNSSSEATPLAEQEITVAPNATAEAVLTVDTSAFSGIRGVVTAQGRPQPNIKIENLAGFHVEQMIAITSATGAYEFPNLTGKTAHLLVSHPDKNDALAEKTVDLVPGETVTVDIDLPAGTARVSGTVRLDGAPAKGKRVFLTPFDGAEGQTLEAETDANGQYLMNDVLAGLYVAGIQPNSSAEKAPTQSLLLVMEGQTTQRDFDLGGGTIDITVAGIAGNERGHLVVFPGEVILDEVTEDALMALAPRAIKYLRTDKDTSEYRIPGLAAGTYTVYGAAHPKEEKEGEDVLAKMRVLYAVTAVSNEQPAEVAFDFNAPGSPATTTEPAHGETK